MLKARVQIEVEMTVEKVEKVDIEKVKQHVQDMKALFEEGDIIKRKSFLRSFIKAIEIKERQAVIHYNLPAPNGGKPTGEVVLPIIPFGGAEETRTPDFLHAKQALSQLSYSPIFPRAIRTRVFYP